MKLISSVRNLKGKKVLVRVDFNVPVVKGKVEDESRLKASLQTITYLSKKGAKVVLISHLGRPDGKAVASLKLDPVAKALTRLLKKNVKKIGFKTMNKDVDAMRPGQVVLLENIRFHEDEGKNTGALAQQLASIGDFFVLDGFAVAHRASASVVGIAEHLPSYAGLLLEKEIKGLDKVLKKPKKPVLAIIGGAKAETKIPVIKNLLPKVDTLLIGGGILNTYLFAKGYGVGASLIDQNVAQEALKYGKSSKVIKPVDVVVGDMKGKNYRIVTIKKTKHEICAKDEMILDAGPQTVQLYAEYIIKAKTLVWNGALGYFEQAPYHIATAAIADVFAERCKSKSVFGVIGGGETVQVAELFATIKSIDLVSTGGGAMLEYLSGDTLPGIKALG